MKNLISRRLQLVLGAAIIVLSGLTNAQIEPPQGYIGFQRNFTGPSPLSWSGTQIGFSNLDFYFQLDNTSADLAGTFWSNSIAFLNSTADLPANHVGGEQGGYIGVQVLSETQSIAIFSLWWTTDSEPGPGAYCVEDIEAWYNDDDPWNPPINSMDDVDPNRPLAGGPFRSCRLPVTLIAGHQYRLRVFEISDAAMPNDDEWWGAWLIDDSTGQSQKIGQLRTPGSWDWLNLSAGGFIEHFGPMPNGCASIPSSKSRYFSVTAHSNQYESSISANTYGDCKPYIDAHSTIDCAGKLCDITILGNSVYKNGFESVD